MNAVTISSLLFASIFGCAILGMVVRGFLPGHHLAQDSKDVVKLGTGLVGTMAALVLGLLVSAAKSSYDTEKTEVTDMCANVLVLDRTLAHYGPEASDTRELLRQSVAAAIDRMWAADKSQLAPTAPAGDALFDAVQRLPANDDVQRSLKSQAQSVLSSLARTRMLLYEQSGSSISMPLLIVMGSWFSLIFLSFGLFAPRNATVLTTLFVCALSVGGAIFLILEMDQPFSGIIHISSEPVRAALTHLGK